MLKNKKSKKRFLAISQIVILVLGIVAISYAIGSEVKVVKAVGEDEITSRIGQQVTVTVEGQLTKTGKLVPVTEIGKSNSQFPYTLLDSANKPIDFNPARPGDSAFFNPNIVETISDNVGNAGSISTGIPGQLGGISGAAPNPVYTPSSTIGGLRGAESPIPYSPSSTTGGLRGASGAISGQSTPGEVIEHSISGYNRGGDITAKLAEQTSTTTTPATESPGALTKVKDYGKTVLDRAKASFTQIWQNAAIALGLYKGVRFLVSTLAPNWEYGEALSVWGEYAGKGWGIGSGTQIAIHILTGQNILGLSSFAAGFVGLTISTIVFIMRYREEKQEYIIFNCLPWQPESKGQNCNKCGENGLPCSRYQCMSLGISCELVNEGTDEEACIWDNPNDLDPPKIQAWDDALKDGYSYKPDNAVSPPDKGVIVNYDSSSGGCAPPFSVITFGIELDKRARCKISTEREKSYKEMPDALLSAGLYLANHSISVKDDPGEHELFVRCESRNEISNPANFVFKYCISEEPDTEAPEIVLYNPLNGFPIRNGLTSINTKIYLDEPAECKWSHTDQDFGSMAGIFSCVKDKKEINAQMLYQCETILDGLVDNINNDFYFRCKDQPNLAGTTNESDRNVNQESYKYTLVGTRPLVVDSIAPNGTVKGASDTVKVTLEAKTSAGFDQGKANCYYNEKCYRENGNEENYILFDYATSDLFTQYQHSQNFWLVPGNYECSIRCDDLGGNSEIKTTTYTVESDTLSPVISRVYYEAGDLKLVTDEAAECVYDITDCSYNFEDGLSMKSDDDDLSHYTEWNTKTNVYIKCKDKYGNEPPPSYCSIIVRATEVE